MPRLQMKMWHEIAKQAGNRCYEYLRTFKKFCLLHYFFKNLFLSVRLSVSPAPFSSTSQAAATRTFRETAVPLFCRRLVCLSFLHLSFFLSASAESRFCASRILLVMRSSGREKK